MAVPDPAIGADSGDEDSPGRVGHTTFPYAVVKRLSPAPATGWLVTPTAGEDAAVGG